MHLPMFSLPLLPRVLRQRQVNCCRLHGKSQGLHHPSANFNHTNCSFVQEAMRRAALCVLDAPGQRYNSLVAIMLIRDLTLDPIDSTRDQWGFQFWKFNHGDSNR